MRAYLKTESNSFQNHQMLSLMKIFFKTDIFFLLFYDGSNNRMHRVWWQFPNTVADVVSMLPQNQAAWLASPSEAKYSVNGIIMTAQT